MRWARGLVVGAERRGVMGLTYIDATVEGPAGGERAVRFLVDSGATYSLLPDDVWRELGIEPKWDAELSLADGTPVRRPVSECRIALLGRDAHTPVLLGEPGDVALLGVVTLEILGLVFHPLRRELQPMRVLMV